jgi:hypothetical protein
MAWRGSTGNATATTGATFAVTGIKTIGGVGPQLNDIVILHGVATDSTSGTPFTMSSPGFSLAIASLQLTLSNCTFWALIKVAGASEPSSYTVTATGTGSGSATWAAQCNVFTGRNTTTPITNTSTTASINTGSPANIAVPSLVAASLDDILWICGDGVNPTTHTSTLAPPSGFSNTLDTAPGGSFVPGAHSCNQVAFAGGATGIQTGVLTFTGGINDDLGGFMISLAAASGGSNSAPIAWVS